MPYIDIVQLDTDEVLWEGNMNTVPRIGEQISLEHTHYVSTVVYFPGYSDIVVRVRDTP